MRWEESRAEGAQIGTSLPKRHPSRAAQLLKKPGKIGRIAEKIGCRIGKLSVRENRRSLLCEASKVQIKVDQVVGSDDNLVLFISSGHGTIFNRSADNVAASVPDVTAIFQRTRMAE